MYAQCSCTKLMVRTCHGVRWYFWSRLWREDSRCSEWWRPHDDLVASAATHTRRWPREPAGYHTNITNSCSEMAVWVDVITRRHHRLIVGNRHVILHVISQSATPSVGPSTSQPISQSLSQSINQLINQSKTQSNRQSITQSNVRRRQSGRRCPSCLERTTTASHVCTVPATSLQSLENSSLPPFLSDFAYHKISTMSRTRR